MTRRRRRAYVVAGLLGAVGFLAGMQPGMAHAVSVDARTLTVVDGDTVQTRGDPVRTRLVGFNAPETRRDRAMCDAEFALGLQAKARLKMIVASGTVDIEFVRCSCPSGTEGSQICNYGRRCATLRAAGVDVGSILIGEGLAVTYRCGPTSCPAAPSPWCDMNR